MEEDYYSMFYPYNIEFKKKTILILFLEVKDKCLFFKFKNVKESMKTNFSLSVVTVCFLFVISPRTIGKIACKDQF